MTARVAQRKQAILDAALTCFTADGYDAASIGRICEISGASVGSFYHHFGSKEGVAAALYERGIAVYQSGLLEILASETNAVGVVAGMARHHLAWVTENPEWARFLLQMGTTPATAAARPSIKAHNEGLFSSLQRWAESDRVAARLPDVPPVALLALILGPSHALSRAWLAGTIDLDEPVIDQVSSAAVRAVLT